MKINCKVDELSNTDFEAALFEEARNSQCLSKELVCCHEDNKIPVETIREVVIDNTEYDDYVNEVILCSEVAVDGYSCVPNNQCEGLLEVRGASEPTCEDSSQKCCHKSKQLKLEMTTVDNMTLDETKNIPDEYGEEEIACSEVASDGYSCVPSDQCEDLLEVRGAGEPTCENLSQKCCHESKQLKPEIIPVNNLTLDEPDYYGEEEILCSEVASDGYSCVPNDQCEDLLEVRGAGEPTCEDSSQKCCHESRHMKPEITPIDEPKRGTF